MRVRVAGPFHVCRKLFAARKLSGFTAQERVPELTRIGLIDFARTLP
jgi:hypothetical protein